MSYRTLAYSAVTLVAALITIFCFLTGTASIPALHEGVFRRPRKPSALLGTTVGPRTQSRPESRDTTDIPREPLADGSQHHVRLYPPAADSLSDTLSSFLFRSPSGRKQWLGLTFYRGEHFRYLHINASDQSGKDRSVSLDPNEGLRSDYLIESSGFETRIHVVDVQDGEDQNAVIPYAGKVFRELHLLVAVAETPPDGRASTGQ